MTTIKYMLQPGEHVRQVAEHFGFSSTKAIAEHPGNASLLSERGSIDQLLPGDVVTIPEGTTGVLRFGTGRGHEVTVAGGDGTFTLRLDTGFRLPDEENPGDLSKSPVRWFAFGKQTLAVSNVSLTINQDAGGLIFANTTNKRGEAVFPLLDDGKWRLAAEPIEEERSGDFAKADPDADHGLGFFDKSRKPTKSPAPVKSFPTNTAFEAEYRAFSLSLTVEGGVVVDAKVLTPAAHASRPSPIIPFWLGTGATAGAQILAVDWKPDFLRRVKTSLRPFQKKRRDLGPGQDGSRPEMFTVHTTTGASISGALFTFLHPKVNSGAHFINDVDGHLVRMADDRYFTQHAGGYRKQREPNWGLGRALDSGLPQRRGLNINDRAIGVENVHKENTKKADFAPEKQPYTAAQYLSLNHLIKDYRSVYGIKAYDVVGHQDVTPKARCPGPHFEWEKIEGPDGALAPGFVPHGQEGPMFGGFFDGTPGSGRKLKSEDREEVQADGTFRVLRGNKVLAEGLLAGPIATLAAALRTIGYGIDQHIEGKKPLHHSPGHMDRVLVFCLAQFVRRFCSGSRQRPDQYSAYLETNIRKNTPRVFLDAALAELVVQVEAAAIEESTR